MGAFVRVSKVLACSDADSGQLFFRCPGCDNRVHSIHYGRPGDWGFNGNVDAPTFTPSVLVRHPWGPEQIQVVCHSFVVDGKIQFLGDCTHALKGKHVDLPDFWVEEETDA